MYPVFFGTFGASVAGGMMADPDSFILNAMSSLAAFSLLVLVGAPLLSALANRRAQRLYLALFCSVQQIAESHGALTVALFGQQGAERSYSHHPRKLELLSQASKSMSRAVHRIPRRLPQSAVPEAHDAWVSCRRIRHPVTKLMWMVDQGDEEREQAVTQMASDVHALTEGFADLTETIYWTVLYDGTYGWWQRRRSLRFERSLRNSQSDPNLVWWHDYTNRD